MNTCEKRIHYESRFELKPDMSIIETFQDGSQLIRKNGLMIIVDTCVANITPQKIKAKINSFSTS